MPMHQFINLFSCMPALLPSVSVAFCPLQEVVFHFLPSTNINFLSREILKKYSCSFCLFSFHTVPLFKLSHCVLSLEGWWRIQLTLFLICQGLIWASNVQLPLDDQEFHWLFRWFFLEFKHKLDLSFPWPQMDEAQPLFLCSLKVSWPSVPANAPISVPEKKPHEFFLVETPRQISSFWNDTEKY